MSKWISGQQLLNEFQIRDIELFSDFVKRGLQPYSELGKKISPADLVDKITNITGLEKQYHEHRFSYSEAGDFEVKEFDATIGFEMSEQIENYENWIRSVKDVDWNEFVLPDSEKEAEAVLSELTGSLYLKEDIKKIFGAPEMETEIKAPAKTPRPSTVDKQKVQRAARELFDKYPEFDTYENFFDLPEIMEAGGKHYAENTLKKWISKVAPERLKRKGIRPKKK